MDIAWVWDHQAPPLQASAWAVTVTQIQLDGAGLRERPRARALPPAGDRTVIPVVHVQPAPHRRAEPLNDGQRRAITERVVRAAAGGWVQLDFEALPSQRDSYHALVREIRAALPPSTRLSVTVLAWQCRSAAWITPLAADEIVPMFFQLGRDADAWIAQARAGGPQLQPRCRQAGGFTPSLTPPEGLPATWSRRYWFNLQRGAATHWTPETQQRLWPSSTIATP
ncbi:hypothetical protein ACS5PN_22370 [Roseateles sp. NT4]|uniref:hypothetical protein n=1 Tax=Roseateles sp. NT4 TaxID=3453715 RepID=UPI003EEC165B